MAGRSKLRILLVNDDGVDAPGLRVLEEAARRFSEDLWIVAPDEERSGAGHSVSLRRPIRLIRREERRFAVTGTPTDCVLLALREVMQDRKPDLLLSGVNRGGNLAEDVTYSGTASAAMEGLLSGVPSIAFSQSGFRPEERWETARAWAPLALERLLGASWPSDVLLNVNFPNCPPEAVTGFRATRQGRRPSGAFAPAWREDEEGERFCILGFEASPGGETADNDLGALRDRAVSVTPLKMDMTADHALADLSRLLGGKA